MHLATEGTWIAFCLVWTAGALTTKRTARPMPGGDLILHAAILAVGVAFLLAHVLRVGVLGWHLMPDEPWVEELGGVLQIAGLAVCIWARLYLGGNWSSGVEIKEDHALIRGGPYGFVRHPIYSGLLLAILGVAIDHGEVAAFVGEAILLVEWKRKSLIEERLMLDQFGAEYKRYRAEVKGLIPSVW